MFVVGFFATLLIAAEGLVPFEPGSVKLGGEIGHHLDLTVNKILHHTDIDKDFVAPFRKRVSSDGTVFDLPKIGGTRGGFVGYGMLLDAVVKACAREIGGAELKTFKERRIAELISLQGADGSISMFTSVPKGKIGWPQAAVWDNHEAFYIIQALVGDWTHFRNRAALEAAKRLADHLIEREGFVNVGGETAFIMLWQATGETRYRTWIETKADLRRSLEHGYGELLAANSVYHVYTGLARACAQLEYAAAIGSSEACYFNTPRTLATRLFGPFSSVTGSCAGGKPDSEGEFWRTTQRGTRQWGETCATAYMMRFATKMMATDTRSRYGDLIERGLYNAFFSAQSPDGVRYRYFNPFEENGEWWPRDTYCCPNNFRREMFEVVDAAILKAPKGAAINLYSDATLRTKDLTLAMKTRYPEDGAVSIIADCSVPRELWLRIPAWCPQATVTVGSAKTTAPGGDWHRLNLSAGRTQVGLDLPLVDRYVAGMEEQTGKVARLRGPLVYGFDKDGRSVRFSDFTRERVYFVPPPDVTPVPDELFSTSASASQATVQRTFCNPMSLPDVPTGVYCRDAKLGMELPPTTDWKRATWKQHPTRRPFREVADPTIYVENGVWYLYPSGGLLWKSTDCGGTWEHVESVKESRYAPAFCKFRGKYYLATFDGPLCIADSPEGPFRELGYFDRASFGDDPKMPKFYDPDFLVDGDHLYLYWGCCAGSEKAIWGAELDPENPLRAKSSAVCLVTRDPARHPWQFNVEGAWVFKRKDTYYLTYSVGGTESPRYAWIALKGPTPLGPFTPQKRNPFYRTSEGLITGTAHGCIFDAGNDDWWICYCVVVGGYHYFERLCGLDRIGFDGNGDIEVSQATSTPQWLPRSGKRGSAGWKALPLSGNALEALDGSLKTWWEIGGALPASLEFSLDNVSVLHAARLVWKDVGLDPLRGVKAGPFRYRLSVRAKGKWAVWIDASTNDRDLLVDYREGPAVAADALRLEVLAAPKGITPALDEFTAFGTAPEDFQ